MKFKHLFLTLFACQMLVSAAIAQQNAATSNGNNAFAFELFKQLYSNSQNVFFSPYSVRSALAMTYSGAEKETKEQMAKVLHLDLDKEIAGKEFLDFDNKVKNINKDTTVRISVANALWKKEDVGYPFKQEYLDLAKKYYNASVFPLPPKAKPINDWVYRKTNGRISNMIADKDITRFTRLILTNAIYFKGEWQNQFKKADTRKDKFKTANSETIDVDMMFQKGFVDYFEDENTQAIKLPYEDGSVLMTIMLPKENSSIETLAKAINANFITKSRFFDKEVEIHVPRFTFRSSFELSDRLVNMGMPDAFIANKADFSGMSDGARVHIEKVIHKSFVEMNEKGTEAAAATTVEMAKGACMGCKEPKRIIFWADRPFIVLITEKTTGNVLFMGTVMNPNQN